MMGNPTKTVRLHYPMIQFLIKKNINQGGRCGELGTSLQSGTTHGPELLIKHGGSGDLFVL